MYILKYLVLPNCLLKNLNQLILKGNISNQHRFFFKSNSNAVNGQEGQLVKQAGVRKCQTGEHIRSLKAAASTQVQPPNNAF